jgi:hypothetical protein
VTGGCLLPARQPSRTCSFRSQRKAAPRTTWVEPGRCASGAGSAPSAWTMHLLPGRCMASGVVSPRPNVSRYSPQARTVTKMNDLLPDALPPGSPLARRAAVVSCWLCGVRLHQNQMVPDGAAFATTSSGTARTPGPVPNAGPQPSERGGPPRSPCQVTLRSPPRWGPRSQPLTAARASRAHRWPQPGRCAEHRGAASVLVTISQGYRPSGAGA